MKTIRSLLRMRITIRTMLILRVNLTLVKSGEEYQDGYIIMGDDRDMAGI